MPEPVFAGRASVDFAESEIEGLSVGKANHLRDFLDAEVGVALVGEEGHGFFDAELVDEGGIGGVEPGSDDGGNVSGVCAEVFGELPGGVVLVLILFLDEYHVDDAFLEVVHQSRTDQGAVGGFLACVFFSVIHRIA